MYYEINFLILVNYLSNGCKAGYQYSIASNPSRFTFAKLYQSFQSLQSDYLLRKMWVVAQPMKSLTMQTIIMNLTQRHIKLQNLLQIIYLTLYLDIAMADFCKTRSAAEYWAKSSGRVGVDRPPLCWEVRPSAPSEFILSILVVSGVAHCKNFSRTESPDWSTTS